MGISRGTQLHNPRGLFSGFGTNGIWRDVWDLSCAQSTKLCATCSRCLRDMKRVERRIPASFPLTAEGHFDIPVRCRHVRVSSGDPVGILGSVSHQNLWRWFGDSGDMFARDRFSRVAICATDAFVRDIKAKGREQWCGDIASQLHVQ